MKKVDNKSTECKKDCKNCTSLEEIRISKKVKSYTMKIKTVKERTSN